MEKKKILLPDESNRSDIIELCINEFGLTDKNYEMLQTIHRRRKEIISNKHWRKLLGHSRTNRLLENWETRFDKLTSHFK